MSSASCLCPCLAVCKAPVSCNDCSLSEGHIERPKGLGALHPHQCPVALDRVQLCFLLRCLVIIVLDGGGLASEMVSVAMDVRWGRQNHMSDYRDPRDAYPRPLSPLVPLTWSKHNRCKDGSWASPHRSVVTICQPR